MKNLFKTLSLGLFILALSTTSVIAQSVTTDSSNTNANTNSNESGASATGGLSENLNLLQGDNVDSDSTNLVLYPIPPLSLQNIDQMIQTKLGTVNCAVEDQGGTEVRIGFPPAILFKDQNLDGGECMAALNTMSKYMQADVLTNMTAYISTLNLSPEYKLALKDDLTNQILDLFIDAREELEQDARYSTIDRLQAELAEIEPKEDYETWSLRVLQEGRTNNTPVEVEVEEVETPIRGGF